MNASAPKKRGCLFYGCLGLTIFALLAVVVGYFGVRYAFEQTKKLAMEYTDTAPMPMPAVQLSAEQREALHRRLAEFNQALTYQTNAKELALTADEINVLLAEEYPTNKMGPPIYVQIEGDQLKGQVSLPLPDMGPLKLKGRYLNGLATLKLQLTNDLLNVQINQLQVKSNSLPEAVLTELNKQDFTKELQNHPDAAKFFSQCESVRIEDGKVVLKNRVRE